MAAHVRAVSTPRGVLDTDAPFEVRVPGIGHIAGRKHAGRGALEPVNIETAPYPGFPTDMQAQWMALMTQAE